MSNNKTNQESGQVIHDWVQKASHNKLAWMLASSTLSQQLLEHAMFCGKCSARINAIEDAEFRKLTAEERGDMAQLAARFVEEKFADKHGNEEGTEPDEHQSSKSKIIEFPKVHRVDEDSRPNVRLAADSDSEESGNRAPEGLLLTFLVGNKRCQLFEDPTDGTLFLTGSIPNEVTHIRFGEGLPYELKRETRITIEGISLVELEEFLRRRALDPESNRISFISR